MMLGKGITLAGAAAAAAGLSLLAGCGDRRDPAVASCELAVVEMLTSPSSYKFVSANVGRQDVFLHYDADNSFGAAIRGIAKCTFQIDRGSTGQSSPTFDLVSVDIPGFDDPTLPPLLSYPERSAAGVARIKPSDTELAF